MRPLIKEENQIIANVATLQDAVDQGNGYARSLIARGTNFVVVSWPDATFGFAPSRFAGYVQNSLDLHLSDPEKDGKVTDPAISKILDYSESPAKTEASFQKYCKRLGIAPRRATEKKPRRFWKTMSAKRPLIDDVSEAPAAIAVIRMLSSTGPSTYESRSPGIAVITSGLHQKLHNETLAGAKDMKWEVVSLQTTEVALPDLAVTNGKVTVVFEIKSTSRLADVYCGVGQLLLYSQWIWPKTTVQRVLVIPSSGSLTSTERRAGVNALGIDVLAASGGELRAAVKKLLGKLSPARG